MILEKESRIERRLSELYDFLNSDEVPYLFIILSSAVILSCISSWIFVSNGLQIAHFDAKGHLLVARRLFDNLNPGFKQIGAFWLPLPHFLYFPFVHSDYLYFNGLAALPITMCCFIGTVWVLFRLIEVVFGRFAAFLSSVLYVTNPNMLYLQTTPLTENLSMFFMVASVYLFVLFWKRNQRIYLMYCSFISVLGVLSRYENWPVFGSLGLLLIILSIKERRGFKNLIIDCLILGVPNFLAIGLTFWINWYTTGHYYIDITFKRTDFQPAQGSYFLAFFVILFTLGNLISYDWVLFGLIAAGLVLKKRFRDTTFLASLALLGPFLIYMYAYQDNHPTRIRYGLPFVPAAVFFLAFWPGKSKLITFLFLIWTTHILLTSPFYKVDDNQLLQESMRDAENLSVQAGLLDYMRNHDDGTLILSSMGDNAPLLYDLKLPVKRYVHEGAKPYWNDAVTYGHPEKVVGWIFMQQDDPVWRKFHDDPEFHKHFACIGHNGFLELYKRTADENYNIHSHRDHAAKDKNWVPKLPGV